MGGLELIILLALVLLFFGAKRLPQLGRSLGSGMREFRKGATGVGDEDDEELQERKKEEKPSLNGVASSDEEGLPRPEKYSREESIRAESKH